MIIGFDTETTGFFKKNLALNDVAQPHLVQLGAVVYDERSRKEIQSMDVIIEPDGWEIPESSTAIHGITTKYATEVGVSEETALKMFIELWAGCNKRVGFNVAFDNNIIAVAMDRYFNDNDDDEYILLAENWHQGDSECAMLMATPIVKKPKKHHGRVCGGYGWTKLTEAYLHFTGKELVDTHSAMADTRACMEVYFKIKEISEA